MKMSHGTGTKHGAGRVRPALVIARDDDALAFVLEHDLRRAEHMAGGHEADVDLADADRLVIGDRLPVLRPVAHLHDRQRLRRRQHRAMPAARMIGMAVRDQRLRPWAATGSIHASAGRT